MARARRNPRFLPRALGSRSLSLQHRRRSCLSTYRLLRLDRDAVPSQEEAEARLHQEGYESFKWYDVPGACYPEHFHAQDECIWVLKGELIFEIESEKVSLKAGDRLYLPAKLRHTAQVSEKGSVTYLVGEKKA